MPNDNLLPHDWQDEISEVRRRVEHRWSTPSLGAIARFVAEEGGEALAILNRLENPELLRSTPLKEKDLPQRELGQVLCMVGTLGTALEMTLTPVAVTARPTAILSSTWINLQAAEIAHIVGNAEHHKSSVNIITVGRILEEIIGHVLILAEQIEVNPFVGMIDFLQSVEDKVAEKDRAEQEATSAA
jgi:hypothetical protein